MPGYYKSLGDRDYLVFFLIGAKLTPFFYGKFTLINKDKLSIKVFEPFEDSFQHSAMINAILILIVIFLSDQVSQ